MTRKKYKRGEIIAPKKSRDNLVRVVCEGSVALRMQLPTGGAWIPAILRPPEPVSLSTSLAGGVLPHDIVSLGDVIVCELELQSLMSDQNGRMDVLSMLAKVMASAYIKMVERSLTLHWPIDVRLAIYILEIVKRSSNGVATISMRRTDLAAFVGTTPASLSRSIRRLDDCGLVALRGRRATVKNVRALEKMVSPYIDVSSS